MQTKNTTVRALASAALLLSLSGCATAKGYRKVASSSLPLAATVAEYSARESSPERAEVRRLLASIYSRHVVLQRELQELDANLDRQNYGSAGPLDQQPYFTLLGGRSLQERDAHKILEIYQKKIEQTLNGGDPSELDALTDLIDGATSGQGELPPGGSHEIARRAFAHLNDSVTALRAEYRARVATSDSSGGTRLEMFRSGDVEPLEVDIRALTPEEVSATIDANAADPAFIELSKELAQASGRVKREFRAISRGRTPQAETVFAPSNGKSGNVVGGNFPANHWTLTYDDGPHKTHTAAILKNLASYKNKDGTPYKASFFMLAQLAKVMPATIQSQKAAGMDLASHSYTHANLGASGSNLAKEITQARKDIATAIGRPVKLFRLPYGSGVNSTRVRDVITSNNLIHVFWNVDTLDWQRDPPAQTAARAIKMMQAAGRGVVLFHDIHALTVTASKTVMQWLNDNGKTVCTTQGIIDQVNGKIADCRKWTPPTQ